MEMHFNALDPVYVKNWVTSRLLERITDVGLDMTVYIYIYIYEDQFQD